MATHKSAEKRARGAKRRTAINAARVNRVRSYLRKLEDAIVSGDKKAAQAAFRVAEPELMRSASRGVIKKNTASRKISRLSKRIKAMSA
ncbi:MAG: 30S ribosomal protein S20 [Alphaproteobacteria bacterium]|nr:30S ribosomal protein S20 [Alphaproteobacteria bacterium]